MELVFKGFWYLPNNKENKCAGTLTIRKNESCELELLGALNNKRDFNIAFEPSIILGVTVDGKLITLYKTFEISRTHSVPGSITSKYSIRYVLKGDHFENEEKLIFDKIICRFHYLKDWINIYGFQTIDIDNNKILIEYQRPNELQFKVDDKMNASFNFIINSPGHKYTHKAVIEQDVELVMTPQSEIQISQLLTYIWHFQNFISLAVFEPISIINCVIVNSKKGDQIGNTLVSTSIDLYYVENINSFKNKNRHFREFLFLYDDIKLDFEKIIQKWFNQKITMDSITDLFFYNFNNPKKFDVNSFLNIIHAVETFHRRFYLNESISKEEHNIRLKTIIKSVPEIYQTWIETKLGFSNEPSLQERLEVLLELISVDFLKLFIEDKEKFIKQLKDSRNYYTHYSTDLKKKALPIFELYSLTERLKIILIFLILYKTGFADSQIIELIKRNQYRIIGHIICSK